MDAAQLWMLFTAAGYDVTLGGCEKIVRNVAEWADEEGRYLAIDCEGYALATRCPNKDSGYIPFWSYDNGWILTPQTLKRLAARAGFF